MPTPQTISPSPPDAGEESFLPWWDVHELAAGETARWTLGPYSLWVERTKSGYRIAEEREDDRRSSRLAVEVPASERPPEGCETHSLMTEDDDERLVIGPRAADRPLVTRPSDTCRLLGGGEVTLYVSTPVWVHLEGSGQRTLVDSPTVRLSDTWFGPDTRHGELCYAIRTSAFPRLDELPILSFRAITRVRVENPAAADLELQRLALPAPNLALWHDEAQPGLGLWTSSVGVSLSDDGETAEVDVHSRPPRDLEKPRRVAAPRERQSRNVLVRAMSAILR